MQTNKIYQEPCLETLKKMEDNSIDCVISSPPYWQLRDYGYEGQWGLEPTFQEYLEHLWEMMDEIYRVLKPSGTVWINLGDSFSTQSGTNLAIAKGNKFNSESTYLTNRGESGKLIKPKNLPNKCLLLIPHRFAIGCIERGWIVRNDIIWAKRNGMPESVTDRFSKKHEYFFFLVKSEKYFFDLDIIRDNFKSKVEFEGENTPQFTAQAGRIGKITRYQSKEKYSNPLGKNPGDVADFWDINTKPSGEKHYAQYNDELIRKPILAGCPEGGIIYDPFMGSGSTAIASIRANRQFIGSEMSEEYIKIANKRIQPLLNQTKLF
jgi:DNA modification methylase